MSNFKKNIRFAKKGLFAIFLLAASMFTNHAMAEDKPAADFSTAVLSQYVWRGFGLSEDSIVIQPSMTVEYKGLSFNVWGNLDTDQKSDDTNNWNETDFTVSYSKSFGPVGVSGGYIYYALDAIDDSQEVFLSLSYDTFLAPALTVYKEFSHYPHWYITADVSHSFPLMKDISLDLGALVSYQISDDASAYPDGYNEDDEFSGFHHAELSASLNIPVNNYISLTPQVAYTFPLDSDAEDQIEILSVDGDSSHFFGGVTVSFAF